MHREAWESDINSDGMFQWLKLSELVVGVTLPDPIRVTAASYDMYQSATPNFSAGEKFLRVVAARFPPVEGKREKGKGVSMSPVLTKLTSVQSSLYDILTVRVENSL